MAVVETTKQQVKRIPNPRENLSLYTAIYLVFIRALLEENLVFLHLV